MHSIEQVTESLLSLNPSICNKTPKQVGFSVSCLTMEYPHMFLLVSLSLASFLVYTLSLQTSQAQILYQLRTQLEYPKALEIWGNYSEDICYPGRSSQVTVTCKGNFITELKIVGNMSSWGIIGFDDSPILNQTLSNNFSIISFVATLSNLTSLRFLSLVSLGIWGALPEKICGLSSLESLDLSSNFLYGSIPSRISTMSKLQKLRLDDNFFNGTVPDWFNLLSNLTILSLRGNQLKGPIPSSICKIKRLTDLSVSYNHISGNLPDFSNLTSLHVLDLRENRISSELPSMPKGLIMCSLSNNSFSGDIPRQFLELSHLQHLDLSFNFLQGKPPAGLFSLPNISYLNIASNMLSGSLPKHLHCGSALGFVDISTNRFIGGLPSCLSSASQKKVVKFGGNCLSVDPQHQNHESYCQIKGKKLESDKKCIGILLGVIGGIIIVLVAFSIVFMVLCRRFCRRGRSEQHFVPKSVQEKPPVGIPREFFASARFISRTTKLGTQCSFKCRLFSVEELKEATCNFDQTTLIGEGSMGKNSYRLSSIASNFYYQMDTCQEFSSTLTKGYGDKMSLYKGRLESGTVIAIRCFTLRKYSIQNVKRQLEFLSKLQHPHLVSLLGHCLDGGGQDASNVNRVFLIYEYVSNGNYRSHLSENNSEKVLKWPERLSVLIGIAKAVHFLHTGVMPGFFNNHLRTYSILLDEHHIPKLSDYGLSIIKEEIHKVEAKGEGNKSRMETELEDDVYSFGVILHETIYGPIAAESGETSLASDMASFGSQDVGTEMVDSVALATSSEESLTVVISIMKKCISPDISSRPSFEDVLWNVQYAAQVQATADCDRRSDFSRQS